MVLQSTLAPGEDYASTGDLLATDDRPMLTLRLWGKPIKVRGLSLEEREEVRATCWRDDGQRDTAALVREYIRRGMVVPALNQEQAREFIRKHAGSVEQVYLFIDRLTELDYDLIVAQARSLAGLAPGDESDTDAGQSRTDGGSVDGTAGNARGRQPRRAAQTPAD